MKPLRANVAALVSEAFASGGDQRTEYGEARGHRVKVREEFARFPETSADHVVEDDPRPP